MVCYVCSGCRKCAMGKACGSVSFDGRCMRCGEQNPPGKGRCTKCGTPLP